MYNSLLVCVMDALTDLLDESKSLCSTALLRITVFVVGLSLYVFPN